MICDVFAPDLARISVNRCSATASADDVPRARACAADRASVAFADASCAAPADAFSLSNDAVRAAASDNCFPSAAPAVRPSAGSPASDRRTCVGMPDVSTTSDR